MSCHKRKTNIYRASFSTSILLAAFIMSGCSWAVIDKEQKAVYDNTALSLQGLEARVALAEERIESLYKQVNGEAHDEITSVISTINSSSNTTPANLNSPKKVPPISNADSGKTTPALAATSSTKGAPPKKASTSASKPGNFGTTVKLSADKVAYNAALATLEKGNATQAERMFKDFLAAYPQSSLAPNAGYWLGEAYYSQKRYDMAILTFQDVVSNYPKHSKAAASLLKTGYSYRAMGDKANAAFYLNALISDFPSSEPAALARPALRNLNN